jgi:hypothetical protein
MGPDESGKFRGSTTDSDRPLMNHLPVAQPIPK